MSMLTETAPESVRCVRRERVAPWWHTAIIVGVLVLWAVYGALRAKVGIVSDSPRWLRYSAQMMILWLMTGTTIAGLYHRRRFLRGVIGKFEWARDIGTGVLIFVAGMILLGVVGVALQPLHLSRHHDAVVALGPRTYMELAIWMLVSASAGICEEFLFRGYLLRQVLHSSGSSVVAVAATATLFGCMHVYEGTAAAIQIGALGALLGAVAVNRGRLRQVIIAHFLQDAVAGLMLFYRHP
ncbi:MAG TPA: type II CAAX endopeptidase family protein [Acidobacteriaceae bacterium]|nr:type II CAAX endopeptidase family protein [Acidobacteriaceae bacterium]